MAPGSVVGLRELMALKPNYSLISSTRRPLDPCSVQKHWKTCCFGSEREIASPEVDGIAAGSYSRSWRDIAVSSSHEAVGVCVVVIVANMSVKATYRRLRRVDYVARPATSLATTSGTHAVNDGRSQRSVSFRTSAGSVSLHRRHTVQRRRTRMHIRIHSVRASVRPCVPSPVDSSAFGQLHLLCTINAPCRRAPPIGARRPINARDARRCGSGNGGGERWKMAETGQAAAAIHQGRAFFPPITAARATRQRARANAGDRYSAFVACQALLRP